MGQQPALTAPMGCTIGKAGEIEELGAADIGEVEQKEPWGKSVAGTFDSIRYGLAYLPTNKDQDRYRTPSQVTAVQASSARVNPSLALRPPLVRPRPTRPQTERARGARQYRRWREGRGNFFRLRTVRWTRSQCPRRRPLPGVLGGRSRLRRCWSPPSTEGRESSGGEGGAGKE